MERGDAINLLACMVEHLLSYERKECDGSRDGIELDKAKLITDSMKEISAAANDTNSESNGEQSIASDHRMRSDVIDTLLRSHEFALEAKRSSQSANKWLQSIGWTKTEIASNQNLIHSPEFDALKARLDAAENSASFKQEEISRLNKELSCCRSEIGRLMSSQFQSQHVPISMSMNKSILSTSSSDSESTDNILKGGGGSLVLCSPRPTIKLSASQDESFLKWEKDIENQMNLESRKEILMLKAALEQANRKICAIENKKEDPFLSDIEPINASSEDGRDELFMKIAADIESDALEDTPVSDQGDDCTAKDTGTKSPAIRLDDPALEKELEEYRQALIVSLMDDRTRARTDSITSSEDPNLAQDLSKSNSSEKMINVRMIDGENFSTEWSDLVDLPPPPDHGLRSPIVDAVLRKWSDDDKTRSALMEWFEDIMNGSKSVHSVPSLKLSGLDHQTRDGFVMHVLPLLLHRKDVHVHLTSRAHRITSYEIAVSVTPTTSFGVQKNDRVLDSHSDDVETHTKLSSKHHLMAFQATKNGSHSIKENIDVAKSPNKQIPFLPKPFLGRSVPGLVRSFSNAGSISTAVTSPMSNLTPTRGPHMARMTERYTSLAAELKRGDHPFSRDEYAMSSVASPSLGDDLSVGSSAVDDENKDSQRQSGIIGSISGALGLLSRRKASPAENEFLGASPTIGRSHTLMSHTSKQQTSEDELPYHRIVSAPPGKIGISFVEYRGHAMVSNVSEDSPLVGWVFPSDVLIAIDDIPVSGLRTREIVKILTNRVKQQRNLRMVSAVAMNELTRTGTT